MLEQADGDLLEDFDAKLSLSILAVCLRLLAGLPGVSGSEQKALKMSDISSEQIGFRFSASYVASHGLRLRAGVGQGNLSSGRRGASNCSIETMRSVVLESAAGSGR